MGQGRWASRTRASRTPPWGCIQGPEADGAQGLHGPRGPARGGVYKGPQGPGAPTSTGGGGLGPGPYIFMYL